MRVVFFAVAALAAGVFSSPVAQVQTDGNTVQKRQLEQPAAIISALHDAVVAQTGPISKCALLLLQLLQESFQIILPMSRELMHCPPCRRDHRCEAQ